MEQSTLLLRLCGPMQSWGVASQFDDRDTEHEPSKSGVLGLLCAAMGVDRDNWNDLEPLTRCLMGVRVDRPGSLRVDYQTAQLQPWKHESKTTQTWKSYLSDANFLVGLQGPDRGLLEKAAAAVRNPHWPLSLGRKSFLPSLPVAVDQGLRDEPLERALRWEWPTHHEERVPKLRVALECDGEGALRMDQPVGPFSQRIYGPRHVKYQVLEAEPVVLIASEAQP